MLFAIYYISCVWYVGTTTTTTTIATNIYKKKRKNHDTTEMRKKKKHTQITNSCMDGWWKITFTTTQNMVEPGISFYSTLSKHTGKKKYTSRVFCVWPQFQIDCHGKNYGRIYITMEWIKWRQQKNFLFSITF